MKFGIMGNISKPMLPEVVSDLVSYFVKKKLDFVVSEDIHKNLNKNYNRKIKEYLPLKKIPGNCDVLIALGGDGTMLTAARIVGRAGIPIFGINLGKLGFLAEVNVKEMFKSIDSVINNNFLVENRMVLEAFSNQKKKHFFGLNDIVIDRGAYKRMIKLEAYVDDKYLVTYSADGLIITTPTGSTAYSLAAGGPVVFPETDVIIINPIAAHSLTARPVIVPNTGVIKVIVKSESKIHLTADGQEEEFYQPPAEFVIKKADYNVKIIKMKRGSYFDLLRTKLHWGRDLRFEK